MYFFITKQFNLKSVIRQYHWKIKHK